MKSDRINTVLNGNKDESIAHKMADVRYPRAACDHIIVAVWIFSFSFR